jgi:hypothetical protein
MCLWLQVIWDPPYNRGYGIWYGYGLDMVLDQGDLWYSLWSYVIYSNPFVDHLVVIKLNGKF